MAAPVPLCPVPPSPTISKSLLEQVTGCQVLSHLIQDGTKPGDNWMSVIYAVTAEVIPPGESSSKETRHYFFKCYPRHPERQGYLNKTNMFYNELSFYSIWAKALEEFQTEMIGLPKDQRIIPAFPPFIGGKALNFVELKKSGVKEAKIYSPIDNFIVLTDLRKTSGYQMWDSTTGLEFEHVCLTILELAKIHALSWAYRQKVEWNLLKKFPFLKCVVDSEDIEMWGKVAKENVEIAVKTMDAALGEGNLLSVAMRGFEAKVGKVIELFLDPKEDLEKGSWELHRLPPAEMVAVSEGERIWRVVGHGDTWSNNLLFKNKETSSEPEAVTLIDFQLARESCPTADLVYFLYTSTTVDFRRRHLRDILQIYHDKFNETCKLLKVDTLPDFSMEALQRRFHRAKVCGFMMAVSLFPMMLKKAGKASNLEQVECTTGMADMMIDAFTEGASSSDLYKTRILEVAQEMYDEGVI